MDCLVAYSCIGRNIWFSFVCALSNLWKSWAGLKSVQLRESDLQIVDGRLKFFRWIFRSHTYQTVFVNGTARAYLTKYFNVIRYQTNHIESNKWKEKQQKNTHEIIWTHRHLHASTNRNKKKTIESYAHMTLCTICIYVLCTYIFFSFRILICLNSSKKNQMLSWCVANNGQYIFYFYCNHKKERAQQNDG